MSSEASSSVTATEFSSRSGELKENTEVQPKRRSENAWRFFYVRRKRIVSQHSNLHFLPLSEVKDHNISKDFVCEVPVRSHHVAQSTWMDAQYYRLFPDLDSAEEFKENGFFQKENYSSHAEKVPLFSDTFEQEGTCNSFSSVSEDCTGFRNFRSNDSHHLSRETEDISVPRLPVNIRQGDKGRAMEETLDFHSNVGSVMIDFADADNILEPERLFPNKLTIEKIGASIFTSDDGSIDLSNCMLNMENEMDFDEDESIYDSSHVPMIKSSHGNHNDLLVLAHAPKLCRDMCHGSQDASFSARDVVYDMSKFAQCSTLSFSEVCESPTSDINQYLLGESRDDKTACSLNREGSEIPCNDDFPSTIFSSSARDVVSDISKLAQGITLSSSEVCESPTSDINQFLKENRDDKMACSLNMEDSEIPCNDDFPSTVFSSSTLYQWHKVSNAENFCSYYNGNKEEKRMFKMERKLVDTSTYCQAVKQYRQLGDDMVYLSTTCGNKNGFPNSQSIVAVAKQPTAAPAHMSPCKVSPKVQNDVDGTIKGECFKVLKEMDMQDAEGSGPAVLNRSPSRLYQEQFGSDIDDSKLTKIWEMIMNMDFCQDDQNSCVNREVPRCLHQEPRRSFTGSKHCAQPSIQRAIASRGALAILYGLSSKYYIKNAEVVLGRATTDFPVDIDLGGGGGANTISRRQALIKMERDGSFFLKNLGRSSMFLDGVEVPSGKCAHLSPSCLIEVKGIKLSFEINRRLVRQYLAKLVEGSQGVNSNFEWLPEGIHGQDSIR